MGSIAINDGSELFGSVTEQPASDHRNGFLALRAFDTNGDGIVNITDPMFASLQVWVDANTNGRSEPWELHSLHGLSILGISLDYATTQRVDKYGNRFRYHSRLILGENSRVGRRAWDVFLVSTASCQQRTSSDSTR